MSKTPPLNWASSKTVGRITEIAVLTPVKKGRVPGERRTYEERAAAAVDQLEARVQQGLPNVLNLVSSIHFGRIMLLRPEQYLTYSDVGGITYDDCAPEPIDEYDRDEAPPVPPLVSPPMRGVPAAIDPYDRHTTPNPLHVRPPTRAGRADLRSFLLTTVEFDGDLKVYFRDIAVFFNQGFDQLFENCEDYPGTDDFERFWRWIRRYQVNTALFYSAYPQLSVTRIKQLELFKRRFDAFVAQVRSPTGPRVASIDALFDEFLRENQQIAYGFPAPGGMYQPNGQDEGSL